MRRTPHLIFASEVGTASYRLDDTDTAATPGTTVSAADGGTFIRHLDFSINFRHWPPPALICTEYYTVVT
jgi:hypothetical protein